MCQGKKKETSKKIQEATESVSESEESVGRIIQKVAKMDVKKDETIYTKLKIAPMEDNKVEHSFCPATDTGVRKTILCRSDWMKINKKSKLYKTDIKFRPYGTGIQLPIRGRAKVWLRAQAGAMIKTYVYVNDDDNETSLLGKNDAERLGIVKITMLPDHAWQHVHADFKGPIGKRYYLHTFIDQFSKYPVVEVCNSTSWSHMEPQLDRVTGMIGNMEVLVTDGGPPYSSNEFAKYLHS